MPRSFVLYLIRHGEANHNVQERMAQEQALADALARGCSPEETKKLCEEARRHVLDDPSFFDASLSTTGIQQAMQARQKLADWIAIEGLPEPQQILVSPLKRTLQTADLVFPDHTNIHVREDLRERLTGRPADNRASTEVQQESFSRFSFRHVRLQSMLNWNLGEVFREGAIQQRPLHRKTSSLNTDVETEDEEKVRERASKLFRLLNGLSQDMEAAAIVTHKGYLRGLERGPLDQIDAPLFGNCEIRAYRLTMSTGHHRLRPEVAIRIK